MFHIYAFFFLPLYPCVTRLSTVCLCFSCAFYFGYNYFFIFSFFFMAQFNSKICEVCTSLENVLILKPLKFLTEGFRNCFLTFKYPKIHHNGGSPILTWISVVHNYIRKHVHVHFPILLKNKTLPTTVCVTNLKLF